MWLLFGVGVFFDEVICGWYCFEELRKELRELDCLMNNEVEDEDY